MQGAKMAKFAGWKKLGSRFRKETNGNIAVIFALSAVPLISFVGAAIDYTRASAARSSMQAALDSTALMLSRPVQRHDQLVPGQYKGDRLLHRALQQQGRAGSLDCGHVHARLRHDP